MEDAYNRLQDAILHQADRILIAGEAIESDRQKRVADLEEKQATQRQISLKSRDDMHKDTLRMDIEEREVEEYINGFGKDFGTVEEKMMFRVLKRALRARFRTKIQ